MGLMQEGLRTGEIRNALHPINLNPSGIKVNSLPTVEAGLEAKIGEIARMLSVEQKEGKETEGLQPQETSKNGFEPFVNPKPSKDTLFINGYNGNFAQVMQLNRKGVERALRIAHLDGKIVLTQFIPSRKSFSEIQGNELAAKRNLFFEEKTDTSQEESNQLYRTVPIKEGWRIEINDGKIIENLNEKGLIGKKRQKTFIRKFSQLLNKGLFECIRKEKMTGIKDEHFRDTVFLSVINPVTGLSIWAIWAPILHQADVLGTFTGLIPGYFTVNLLLNLSSSRKRSIERLNTNSSAYIVRKLDARWEYFMPQIEIDKVARSWAFLFLKGRKLVRDNSEINKPTLRLLFP